MDRFSVSMTAWHAFSQLTGMEDAPRSYLVEGCQRFCDRMWNVTRTPGAAAGAELPFKDLLEWEIRKYVSFTVMAV